MLPIARTAHLVIQELPNETLVFDRRTSKAHCLNRTTALIWRHCDGRTDFTDLARLVEDELAIGGGAAVVQLALEQLASRHLLEGAVERGSPAQRRSRRELLKQLTAAAVALPVILTVAAPRANAAGSKPTPPTPPVCSGQPDGTTCGTGLTCCQGACCVGGTIACGASGCCQDIRGGSCTQFPCCPAFECIAGTCQAV